MAQIKIKRGSGVPAGLTHGELAYDVTNNRLYIGITAASQLLTNTDGGVSSFNGLTGTVTGVTTGTANTFGPLQSFTNGISASGGTFTDLRASFAYIDSIEPRTVAGDLNLSSVATNINIDNYGGLITIGDVSGNANGTTLIVRDATNTITANGQLTSGGAFTASSTITSTGIIRANAGLSAAGSTFSGLTRFTAGISSAGATFSGTINLNGQTFTNVISAVNGLTGTVGAYGVPFGYTSGSVRVFTYPDGVTTTGSKTPLYQPFQTYQILNTAATMTANRTYFTPHVATRPITLKTLQFVAANTGVTGNCYFSVWTADRLTGFPDTRLYVSTSTAIGAGYSANQVTNGSGLVTVPAGPFFIAVSFSSTPYLYCMSMLYVPPLFGSGNMTSGYNMGIPVIDTNGFTAPTSRTQAGTTFGFIDYTGDGAYRQGVFAEFGIL